jgi:hypothetical protein
MWQYAVFTFGAVVVVVAVGWQLWRRKSRPPRAIDVGELSDSWLAEQRGRRDRAE